jgi:hypothetical protein
MRRSYHLLKAREVEKLLRVGDSVIIQAPRFYGKSILARQLASDFTTRKEKRCIELSSRSLLPSRELDFEALWTSVKRQTGISANIAVSDKISFESAVYKAVVKSRVPLLFTVCGARSGNESNHAKMVSIFDILLSQVSVNMPGRLCVILEDDGSLGREHDGHILPSASAFFHEVRLLPLRTEDIASFIGYTCSVDDDAVADRLADWIGARTGGHPGLIAELLEALPNKDQSQDGHDDTQRLELALSTSPILEALSRALEEDPDGFSQTALEYREPRYPEAHSPRIQVLRQLGILQQASPSTRVCLCRGAITSLIEDLARARSVAVRRVGPLITDAGPRIFVGEQIIPSDDDLVVLHLSDLHVGSEYRHLLRSRGAGANIEQRSLGDLLEEDLKDLKLSNRIDAIVLSGDVVGNATKFDQFLRAREVIQEVLLKTGVSIERLLVIPGNHDVDWMPNELSNLEPGRQISWDNYKSFLELLGKLDGQDVTFLGLTSRSGKVRLRIVGLDSNYIEGPGTSGIGYVSPDSFRLAEERIAADERSGDYGIVRTWLAVHHHLLPVTATSLEAARARKVSVMGNASLVQTYASRWNVELVLHGHEHQPAVTVARRWPADAGPGFSPLTVLAAGSVGAKVEFLGPFARNQYFVAYRRAQDIIVRSRCMGDTGIRFVTHNDICLPQPVSNQNYVS